MSVFLLFYCSPADLRTVSGDTSLTDRLSVSPAEGGASFAFLIRAAACLYAHVCGIFLLLRSCFFFSPQNLQWARDVLLGSSVSWQQLKHMPAQGLFCERNKTNLFNVSRLTPRARPRVATRAPGSVSHTVVAPQKHSDLFFEVR